MSSRRTRARGALAALLLGTALTAFLQLTYCEGDSEFCLAGTPWERATPSEP